MKRQKVAIFAADSPLGGELARMLSFMLRATHEVVVFERATWSQYFGAMFDFEAIVLDASIESAVPHNIRHHRPWMLGHLLTVSRTPLPLNYRVMLDPCAPAYPGSLSNQEISEQVLRRLNECRRSWLLASEFWVRRVIVWALLPMLLGLGWWASVAGVLGVWIVIGGFMFAIVWFLVIRAAATGLLFSASIVHGTFQRYSERRTRRHVFISHRSRHFDDVTALAKRIERGEFFGSDQTSLVFCLKPGQLVFPDEVLTELRRWGIVGLIDDAIIDATHLVVYGTPDYLDSWWTLAELSAIAARFPRMRLDAIDFYDPARDEMCRVTLEEMPKLSPEQGMLRHRLLKHGHPDMANPRQRRVNRQMRNIPLMGHLAMFRCYDSSHEFANDHLVPCATCLAHAGVERDFESLMNAAKAWEFTEFLLPQNPLLRDGRRFPEIVCQNGLFVVSKEDLGKAAAGRSKLRCPNCKTGFAVTRLLPRYLYSLDRGGTREIEGCLVELPVFRCRPELVGLD